MNKPAANPSPPGRARDDPDARLLRWGWLAFAAWAVFGGTELWQALRAGEAALVGVALTAPLWAAWLLWLLWRGLAALRRALKRSAYSFPSLTSRIRYVKSDVEGYDLQVLESLKELIRRNKPFIKVEVFKRLTLAQRQRLYLVLEELG